MTKSVRIGLGVIAVLLSFFAGSQLMKWIKQNSPEAKEATSVIKLHRPDFLLPDLDGVKRSVAEWDGKPVVLNFWATWCPPCRREMPMFKAMQKKYADRGLQFIGIALDEEIKVADFVEEMELNYPTLLAGDQAVSVSTAYGNRFGALPFTVLINRDGIITKTFRGEVKRKELEPHLVEIL